MGFQLRDTLRRLCEEIGWSYAVFWRAIDDRSSTHLVWEDGHWHHGVAPSGVEQLVNKIMATQAHVFGEGIVGQAASRGSHIWILRDRMNVVGLGSKDLAELNHQFLAGIQTIAVIPVLPLGVLQLGSSQMVMENIGFVNSVTNFFGQLGCARVLLPGIIETAALAHSNIPYNGVPAISSEVLPDKVAIQTKSMTIKSSVDSMIHSVDKNFNPRDHMKTTRGVSVDLYPGYSSNSSQSVLTAGKQKQETELSQDYDLPSTELAVNGPQAVFSTQGSKFSGSNIAQESQIFHNAVYDANGIARQIKQNIKDNDKNTTDRGTSQLHSMFPAQRTLGDDLYDVLGPDYKVDSSRLNDALVHIGDGSVDGLATHTSTCTPQLDACPISYSLIDGTSGPGMFSGADTDQLLDAVVSKIKFGAKHSTDDSFYSQSDTKIDGSSLPLPDVSPNYKSVPSSKESQGEPFDVSHVLGKADATASSSVISSSSLGNITEECLPSIGACKSQINLWAESGEDMKCDNLSGTQGKRVDENSKLNKKRSRPGENPRPRPKDRQMIMDRVKELREIIPNGAKLSIDALLEKTIKHMLFLQSVTKHGEKLKDIGEPKFIDREGGLQLKENLKVGATWAYEVGTQPTACPIIVEDLNPPRQMLVEMLCEQRGFFLEIADFIRGLGLTILKGVMEVRKDKIWARFAVEANRDVTRVEIFLSLVSLLEPSFGNSATPQGVDKINSLHNVYNRSCIPASGRSDHLQ